MRTKEFITVLNISPYPLEEQGGVARNMRERARHLRPEGFLIYTAGPRKRNMRMSSSYLHFGTAQIQIAHDQTKNDVVTASLTAAKRLTAAIDPDIIHTEEPAAALGQIAPLVMKTPKRPDGRPRAAFGATFHARLEKPTRLNKAELALIRWLPMVETWWGIPIRYRGRLRNMLMETLEDRRIAVSNATESFWQELIPGNYDVLYNGFDTTAFSPDGPKIESWLDDKKTMLMTGRHDSRKGLDIGIKAFALLKAVRDDIKLVIVGEGKETKNLKRLVRDLNVPDVSFVGFLPQSELVKAFRTADVFVSPATGGEGFGRVIPEALACGTPVVASDIAGHREAMRGQPFTQEVPVGSFEGFAYAIDAFLETPQEARDRWRFEAPLYVASNFGWPIIAKRQAEIYRRWLSEYNDPQRKAISITGNHGELTVA